MKPMPTVPIGKCKGCGGPFAKTRKDKETCNNNCANKAWNKRGRKPKGAK